MGSHSRKPLFGAMAGLLSFLIPDDSGRIVQKPMRPSTRLGGGLRRTRSHTPPFNRAQENERRRGQIQRGVIRTNMHLWR